MAIRIKVDLVDFWHPPTREAKQNNPLVRMLSKRWDVEISDAPDFLLYSCFGSEFLRYDCIRIFYTGENIRPNFQECDYAFSFDYPVTDRNYRLPLYALYEGVDELMRSKDIDKIIAEKSGFCTFVCSNPNAEERIEFFQALNAYRRVDSGGRVLNNIGSPVGDKLAFLRPRKFAIAFENSSYPGYTTEKIVHAMLANAVPIYWGNPLIARDFNPRSFINCHDYESMDEVIQHVIEVDNDEQLYAQYLSESYFLNNRPNEYIDLENVLDRFAWIFSRPHARPVAKTWRRVPTRMKYSWRGWNRSARSLRYKTMQRLRRIRACQRAV